MEVELTEIRKHFGMVKANDGISLSVPAGTIQGILGENGAGKSTLMKILSGFQPADSGGIRLDGRSVQMRSPADAIKHGVGMLHQDPLDFPPMRVVDNLLIGAPGRIIPRREQAVAGVGELAGSLGLSIDLKAEVSSLTLGERQQLELLRLLWLGARVLILDEPTTGISARQRQELFDTLRRLVAQGKTVLFVSHKLEEVQDLCTRVAVLRQGRLVGEALPPFHVDRLVTMMFERAVSPGERAVCSPGKTVLHLASLGAERGRVRFEGLDLEARAGETIGLAGMEGSGQSLLLEACAGLTPATGGRVCLDGEDLTGKPYHKFKRRGVAYVPATRLEEGLIPGLSLTDHFLLTDKHPGFFVKRERGRRTAEERIVEFNIKGTPANRVESLSGGNQQRALLALVKPGAKLMLLEHPTRGLDVESVIYLWSKLKERCGQGETIVFTSSDLDELLRYSDRILVFFAGRVSGPLEAASTTVDELGQLMGGSAWNGPTGAATGTAGGANGGATTGPGAAVSEKATGTASLPPASAPPRRFSRQKWINVGLQLGALVLAFLLTSVILLVAGAPPFQAYWEIARGAVGSLSSFSNVLVAWVPLLLAAAGVLVTFAAGLWNIGVEGQIVLGAVLTTWILRLLQATTLPPALIIVLAMLAGVVGGALWAALAGVLKTFGGVNEIFGGLGLNFVATALTLWLIFGPWKRPGVGSMSGTEPFADRLALPTVGGLRLSLWSLVLAIVAVIAVYVLLERTHIGLRLKAVGLNRRAAFLLGVPTWQYGLLAFLLCGGLAGLAGAVQVTAVYHRLIPSISSGYGFLGLMIGMLILYRAIWVAPVALFFAALNIGSIQLPIVLRLDSTLSGVIQGALVLFVLLVEGARQRYLRKARVRAAAAVPVEGST